MKEAIRRSQSLDKGTSMLRELTRKPFQLWGLYFITVIALACIIKAVFPDLRPGPSGLSSVQLLAQILLTLLPIPFIVTIGWGKAGFNHPRNWQDLQILAFPVLTVVFGYLAGFREMNLAYLLTALAVVVLVAFGEEMAFRGILLKALLPRGIWQAVLISSALFGLMHLVNLALGAPWQAVMLQLLFSSMGGVGFAAITLRTNSLWPAIILHAFYDLAFRVGDFTPFTTFSNTYFLLHGVGWIVFAIVVLRPVSRQKLATVRWLEPGSPR